jgi:hypothetical protein
MTATADPPPTEANEVDVCEAAARFLAGLGEGTVAAVRAAHVANGHGDCRGCGWQVATHWPCVHAVAAERAAELLRQRRRG